MKSKILDEFNYELHCSCCNKVTEHSIQKIDEENNGLYIGYYGKCDICENTREVEKKEFSI